MKPQYFVGIGAQKAGTTWLANYLSAHKQVAFSPIKEMHFFNRIGKRADHFTKKFRQRLQNKIERLPESLDDSHLEKVRCYTLLLQMTDKPSYYRHYFDLLKTTSTRIFGEITPAYSMLTSEQFGFVEQLYPDAKYIFIMRDPVDRIWSQIRYNEKIKGVDSRKALKNLDEIVKQPRFLLRSDYRRTLTELERIVPSERIHVSFYEDLFSPERHKKCLKSICNFLCIDAAAGDMSYRSNQGKSVALPLQSAAMLRRELSPVYDYIGSRFDSVPAEWMRDQ